MKLTSYSKLKLAIEELISEEWFRDLYKAPSYNTAIWKSKEIKKNQKHSMEFISLVKELTK